MQAARELGWNGPRRRALTGRVGADRADGVRRAEGCVSGPRGKEVSGPERELG